MVVAVAAVVAASGDGEPIVDVAPVVVVVQVGLAQGLAPRGINRHTLANVQRRRRKRRRHHAAAAARRVGEVAQQRDLSKKHRGVRHEFLAADDAAAVSDVAGVSDDLDGAVDHLSFVRNEKTRLHHANRQAGAVDDDAHGDAAQPQQLFAEREEVFANERAGVLVLGAKGVVGGHQAHHRADVHVAAGIAHVVVAGAVVGDVAVAVGVGAVPVGPVSEAVVAGGRGDGGQHAGAASNAEPEVVGAAPATSAMSQSPPPTQLSLQAPTTQRPATQPSPAPQGAST